MIIYVAPVSLPRQKKRKQKKAYESEQRHGRGGLHDRQKRHGDVAAEKTVQHQTDLQHQHIVISKLQLKVNDFQRRRNIHAS
jgi:hypothetical protein